MMEAVNQDGCALWYVSDELKHDRDVAMEAVEQCGCALQCASEELKGNREFIMEAVMEETCRLRRLRRKSARRRTNNSNKKNKAMKKKKWYITEPGFLPERVRRKYLSNTTCLTQVFFRSCE